MTSGSYRQKKVVRSKQPRKIRKPSSVSIKLAIKALSTNKIYAGVKRRSYHYKNFRKKVFKLLAEYPKDVALSGNLRMTLSVGFSSPLSDLSNAVKAIEDLVMEYYGLNDRYIVDIGMKKYLVYKGDEFIHLTLAKSRRKNVDLRLLYRKGDNVCGI